MLKVLICKWITDFRINSSISEMVNIETYKNNQLYSGILEMYDFTFVFVSKKLLGNGEMATLNRSFFNYKLSGKYFTKRHEH